MTKLRAVILLPQNCPIDAQYAQDCREHVERRGYQLLTAAWRWEVVDAMFRRGMIDVVVMARREHFDTAWLPKVEFVGQTTRDLRPAMQRNAGRDNSRGRRPRVIT